jgi:serine/threonine protein kinase
LEVDLDFKLEKDSGNENAYVLQYVNREGFISYGVLKDTIDGHRIIHYCSTEEGSSGSPILNLKNNKVVGIHYGANAKAKYNYGTLLSYPILDFKNKFKNKYNDKDFKNLKLLSSGSYSDIYSAFSIKDKIEVCLKRINLEKMRLNYQKNELKNYEKDLAREINITKLLSNNENSLKYFGSYNNKTEKILVLEKCDLNYYEFIRQKDEALSVEEIRNKFSKMNRLFEEIQNRKIIHRDIKLENILIKFTNKEKTDYILKLCDYGYGKFTDGIYSGLKGTFETIAPEILLKKTNHYEDKIDIFSLGVILFQLANNLRHPFGIYYPEIVVNYQKNFEKDNFVIKFDDSIKDKQFIDLVSKMLKLNPHNRLKWNSYFEHPFFQNE